MLPKVRSKKIAHSAVLLGIIIQVDPFPDWRDVFSLSVALKPHAFLPCLVSQRQEKECYNGKFEPNGTWMGNKLLGNLLVAMEF